MKKMLFSLALLTSSIASAATPIDGWYSSVFGGYAYLPNHLKVTRDGLLFSDSRFKPGYDVGASFGFKSSSMSYEGQFTYINAEPRHFEIDDVSQTGVKGFSNAYLGMANVYYHFPTLIDPLSPFIGLGLGYGYIEGQFRGTGPTYITHFNGHDNVFAYQGAAGINFNFSEYCALNIAYRYVGTSKIDRFGRVYQANLANIGAIYRFDINQYK